MSPTMRPEYMSTIMEPGHVSICVYVDDMMMMTMAHKIIGSQLDFRLLRWWL